MKTPSQQLSEEIEEIQDDIVKVCKKVINKTMNILKEKPPLPGSAEFSTGKFSESHVIYINGAEHGKTIGPATKLKSTDHVSISNPLHYAKNVLQTGWDGKTMIGVWPGAKHPAYRTYDHAVHEMKQLHLAGIVMEFNAKGSKKR